MNALELIEYLESGYDTQMHEAATLLHGQDAAIKQLREALDNARVKYDYHGNPMEDRDRMVLDALKDTEEFAK